MNTERKKEKPCRGHGRGRAASCRAATTKNRDESVPALPLDSRVRVAATSSQELACDFLGNSTMSSILGSKGNHGLPQQASTSNVVCMSIIARPSNPCKTKASLLAFLRLWKRLLAKQRGLLNSQHLHVAGCSPGIFNCRKNGQRCIFLTIIRQGPCAQ